MVNRLKKGIKNGWLWAAFAIVGLIVWNTNMLFRQMRAEEREKMELWAMAQEESIQNTNLSNLTFEVLQQTGGNPMIQVNESGQILQFRNIDWNAEESDSIVLNQILEKIKKENITVLLIIPYLMEKKQRVKSFISRRMVHSEVHQKLVEVWKNVIIE